MKLIAGGALGEPLSSSSSGMAYRNRSIITSQESDSITSPGTSALSAIQTQASGSQVNFTIISMQKTLLCCVPMWAFGNRKSLGLFAQLYFAEITIVNINYSTSSAAK